MVVQKNNRILAIELAYFAIAELNPRLQNVDIEIHIGKHSSQGGCVQLGDSEFEIEIDEDITGDDFYYSILQKWSVISH